MPTLNLGSVFIILPKPLLAFDFLACTAYGIYGLTFSTSAITSQNLFFDTNTQGLAYPFCIARSFQGTYVAVPYYAVTVNYIYFSPNGNNWQIIQLPYTGTIGNVAYNGSYFCFILKSGSNFYSFYSTDGATWSNVQITSMSDGNIVNPKVSIFRNSSYNSAWAIYYHPYTSAYNQIYVQVCTTSAPTSWTLNPNSPFTTVEYDVYGLGVFGANNICDMRGIPMTGAPATNSGGVVYRDSPAYYMDIVLLGNSNTITEYQVSAYGGNALPAASGNRLDYLRNTNVYINSTGYPLYTGSDPSSITNYNTSTISLTLSYCSYVTHPTDYSKHYVIGRNIYQIMSIPKTFVSLGTFTDVYSAVSK